MQTLTSCIIMDHERRARRPPVSARFSICLCFAQNGTVSAVCPRPSPLCHSLCCLTLLFFPIVTPSVTVLSFLLSPNVPKQDRLFPVHSTKYRVICYIMHTRASIIVIV